MNQIDVPSLRLHVGCGRSETARGHGGYEYQRYQSTATLVEKESDSLKRQIGALAGDPIDPARVRKLLGDFRLLYEVATDEERAELLRLLIARIDFHGKGGSVVISFPPKATGAWSLGSQAGCEQPENPAAEAAGGATARTSGQKWEVRRQALGFPCVNRSAGMFYRPKEVAPHSTRT
jgi:hypothetical protein